MVRSSTLTERSLGSARNVWREAGQQGLKSFVPSWPSRNINIFFNLGKSMVQEDRTEIQRSDSKGKRAVSTIPEMIIEGTLTVVGGVL